LTNHNVSKWTLIQARNLIQEDKFDDALAILLPLRSAPDANLEIRIFTSLFLALIAPSSNEMYYQEFLSFLQPMRDEMGPAWTEALDVLEEAGKSAWEMRSQADGVATGGDTEDIVKGIAKIMIDDTAAKVEEVDGMQVE
jgi:hypothetical protein